MDRIRRTAPGAADGIVALIVTNKGVCAPGHVPTPPRPQTGFARPALPQEPAAPFLDDIAWQTRTPVSGIVDHSDGRYSPLGRSGIIISQQQEL